MQYNRSTWIIYRVIPCFATNCPFPCTVSWSTFWKNFFTDRSFVSLIQLKIFLSLFLILFMYIFHDMIILVLCLLYFPWLKSCFIFANYYCIVLFHRRSLDVSNRSLCQCDFHMKYMTSYNARILYHCVYNACPVYFLLIIASQIANLLGPTWGPPGSCRQDPGGPHGPHVGPMDLATRVSCVLLCSRTMAPCSQCYLLNWTDFKQNLLYLN